MPDDTKKPASEAEAKANEERRMSLAESVKQRIGRDRNEVEAEAAPVMKISQGEGFSISVRELSAITQENPTHPNAAAFRRAVVYNAPDDVVVVDKIDLQALIEDKEVIIKNVEGQEEVEGLQFQTRTQSKSLGGKIQDKNRVEKNAIAPNQFANQPRPPKPDKFMKLGGDEPSRPAPNEGPGTPAREPSKPFSQPR